MTGGRKKPHEDRDWSDSATNHGIPGPPEALRSREGSFPTDREETWPRQHLHVEILDSKAAREQMCCFKTSSFWPFVTAAPGPWHPGLPAGRSLTPGSTGRPRRPRPAQPVEHAPVNHKAVQGPACAQLCPRVPRGRPPDFQRTVGGVRGRDEEGRGFGSRSRLRRL